MSSKVTSDTVVARYPMRGRTFLVRRLTWNDSDGLSFDVYDESTGECLTAGSFDDEPGPDEIRELLAGLLSDYDAGTLDPFFDGNQKLGMILGEVRHKHTLRIHDVSRRHIVELTLGPDEAITVEVDGREYAGVRVPDSDSDEGVSVTTFTGNDDNTTEYPDGADLSYSRSARIHTVTDPDGSLSAARQELIAAERKVDAAVRAKVADRVRQTYPTAHTLVAEGEWNEDGLLHLHVKKVLDGEGTMLDGYDENGVSLSVDFDDLTNEIDALLDEIAERDDGYQGTHEFDVKDPTTTSES